MSKHRNPRKKLPKRTAPDNFTLGLRIRRIYEALVELEALAITADEAVNNLPAGPTGRHKRTLARLYLLVGQTAGRATATLELGEELRHLAEDLGLDQARTGSSVWWRQMVPRPSGAVVVSAGLHPGRAPHGLLSGIPSPSGR
jgi:hypothetical protein